MKKAIFTLSLAAATLFAFASGNEGNNDEAGPYKINTSSSTVNWLGKKVTGEHGGTIAIKNGTISMIDGVIEAADLVIDMTKILVTDEDMGQEYKDKLVGHLMSADFFNVAEHNTSTFRLKTFTPESGENMYTVTGVLTIKGISNEITFPAIVVVKDNQITATADLTFDRSKFDIRYGSGSFFDSLGDNLIYDEVAINFSLVAQQ
jgi:polyisoprenoid-binding protein YceI